MYLTIRKSPPSDKQPEGGVIMEVRMSLEDVQAHHHKSVLLENAVEDAVKEHLRRRSTVSRSIHMGVHG